jgi:RNA polymerase sigma-70 factor (ECF subfamily)
MKSNALFSIFRGSAHVKPIRKLEDVLAGYLSGEEESGEWLYKTYYGYLMGIVLRYLKETAQAEELVNDSFMKIFKNLHGFIAPDDPEMLPKAFKAWVARITSRTVIDHLRISKNRRHSEELTEFHFPEGQVTVLDKLNAGDILKLLDELPQLQRVIFNMHEIEGYKHEEIASAMQIPVKNSRVYLARAKDRLRLLYKRNNQNVKP